MRTDDQFRIASLAKTYNQSDVPGVYFRLLTGAFCQSNS